MKITKYYNIFIGEKLYYFSTSLSHTFAELEKIKKFEPSAVLVTTYE